jgi:hypothetical protein
MPQSWDMGQILSLPLRRKACGGFFRCPKNPTTSAGFEPANSDIFVGIIYTNTAEEGFGGLVVSMLASGTRVRVPEASMQINMPPKPSSAVLV